MDYEWEGLRYTIYMLFERNMEYETTEWDVSKISKENQRSNFEMLAQFKTKVIYIPYLKCALESTH